MVPVTNLKDLLALADDTEIESYETGPLTSAFENYGSLMLALKVKVAIVNTIIDIVLILKLF